MNLAAWAMKYRPIVLTGAFLLMVWGVFSFATMPRREDPEYTVRTCAVTTFWPGAPAEKVEELVTDPIEEAVDRIEDVDVVRSTTTIGMSTVYVDAEETVSPERIDNVWDKVRANVSRVQMPEPGIQPIVNDEFGDTYILLLAVYQTPLPGSAEIAPQHEYSLRELDLISERVKDELRLLPGVAKSEQYGVVEEALYVETDLATWSQLDLTADRLQRLLEARNIVAPGGAIDTDVGRFSVKPGGEFDTVDEMNAVIAGLAGQDDDQRPVSLEDLGLKVVRDYEDPRQLICRFGDSQTSRPGVIVAISMKSGANIVDICHAAKKRVREMQEVERSLPPDIAVTPVSDQSLNVETKINQVLSNVIGAILIVIVVVYLVVGFRSAAVMAANIPVVVLAAIALVTVFGVQLEQISLASIIIALGLLVDNAVQVCDQSRTNQIAGMKPIPATIQGTKQVSIAMLMGTATTVAAFAPMLIGLIGTKREYVYSLPVTLSVTLTISWLLAMTFCTILAAAFIRAPKDPNKPTAPLPWLFAQFGRLKRRSAESAESPETEEADWIDRTFRSAVRSAVDFKFVTVGVAVLLLIGAVMLPVGSEFFPQDLRDQFAIKIWLPETATIAQTDQVALRVEEILRRLSPVTDPEGNKVQRVRAMRTMVGGGGSRWYLSWDPEPRQPNFAEILVRTTDPLFTSPLARRVRRIAERGDTELGIEPIVNARIVPEELYLGPSEAPVEIRVYGPGFADMRQLRTYADEVAAMIRNEPATWDVHDSWGVKGYQLRVNVNAERANLAGVTNLHVAQTLNAYYSGHHLTTYREGDHQVPVFLRLTSEQRGSLDGLSSAYVEGLHGKVPLNAIATVEPRWDAARIERRDMNRTIEVRAQVEPGTRGNDVVGRIMKSEDMAALQNRLPSGFRVEVGGSLEASQESAEQLSLSLGISILTIILLLVIQYNGWAKPMIILTTLPLALIGALPGLWLTGNALGFMPQLGILSLFGIVLNTGIIFIEFADVLIREAAEKSDGSGPIVGLTRDEFRQCLVDAAKQRLLPIFLTTATTIGGLFPLAVAGGPLWEGMAWCMIFGLVIATLLTLLVVPALYALFVETFGVRPVSLKTPSET